MVSVQPLFSIEDQAEFFLFDFLTTMWSIIAVFAHSDSRCGNTHFCFSLFTIDFFTLVCLPLLTSAHHQNDKIPQWISFCLECNWCLLFWNHWSDLWTLKLHNHSKHVLPQIHVVQIFCWTLSHCQKSKHCEQFSTALFIVRTTQHFFDESLWFFVFGHLKSGQRWQTSAPVRRCGFDLLDGIIILIDGCRLNLDRKLNYNSKTSL